MNNLKIEYMALEKLKPYEKNARKHQEADRLVTAYQLEYTE